MEQSQQALDELTMLFKRHKHLGTDMSQKLGEQLPNVLGTTGAVVFNPVAGNIFTLTPTGATQIKPMSFPAGQIVVFRILTSGITSYTITFDVGFVANGTLSTGTNSGRYFTVTFACDGTYWNELSRTVAMLPS